MMSSQARSDCRPAAALTFRIQAAPGVGVYWFVYLFTRLVMMFEHFLQERITNGSVKERGGGNDALVLFLNNFSCPSYFSSLGNLHNTSSVCICWLRYKLEEKKTGNRAFDKKNRVCVHVCPWVVYVHLN